jgi:hypothetical protein
MTEPQEMDIPMSVKEKLVALSAKLPADKRSQFLVNTTKDTLLFMSKLAKEHKYTLVYGAVGYLAGHVLDELLVLTIPMIGVWRPTQNLAGLLLGLAGAGYGFMKDQEVSWFQNAIRREIQNALK